MAKHKKLAVFTITFSYDPTKVDESDENLGELCDEIEDQMDTIINVLEGEFEEHDVIVECNS